VRDRVEQSLETANSIVSSIRDIISGRVPFFFVSTGISTMTSESVTTEEVVPARAAPNAVESAWNAVLLPAVSAYKMSRSLICVTYVWREYKVRLGGNPSIENLDRDYKNAWRRAPVEKKY
jgi:Transcriptional activator of glycolytic enzymes